MRTSIIAEHKAAAEFALYKKLETHGEMFDEVINAAAYSAENGGKRIRPCILMEFAKICGGDIKAAADVASAVEMVHTYSLIHDDLPCMDNDDMRRGRASCHIKFGEATALLAGDGLLTLAFETIAGADLPAERKADCIFALAKYAGMHGMIGGQAIDLACEGKSVDAKTLYKLCSLKTSCLLKAAATLGCLLSGAEENKINAAADYAESLGLAFQITDDILDVVGDEQTLGKPIGSDAQNDKSTFVGIYGLEGARKLAAEYTEKAVQSLCLFGESANELKKLAYDLLERNK